MLFWYCNLHLWFDSQHLWKCLFQGWTKSMTISGKRLWIIHHSMVPMPMRKRTSPLRKSFMYSHGGEGMKQLDGYLASKADHKELLKSFPAVCKLTLKVEHCLIRFCSFWTSFQPIRAYIQSQEGRNGLNKLWESACLIVFLPPNIITPPIHILPTPVTHCCSPILTTSRLCFLLG